MIRGIYIAMVLALAMRAGLLIWVGDPEKALSKLFIALVFWYFIQPDGA